VRNSFNVEEPYHLIKKYEHPFLLLFLHFFVFGSFYGFSDVKILFYFYIRYYIFPDFVSDIFLIKEDIYFHFWMDMDFTERYEIFHSTLGKPKEDLKISPDFILILTV
jgi:hypothetical protein